MQDFEAWFLKTEHILSQCQQEISPMEQLRLADEPVAIFGAGDAGLEFYTSFLHHGIQPVCFADNQKSLQGSQCRGLPVLSAAQLQQQYPRANVAIATASDQWAREIYEQLLYLGYKKSQIISDRYVRRDIISLPMFKQEHWKGFAEIYPLVADVLSQDLIRSKIRSMVTYSRIEPAQALSDEYFSFFTLGDQEVFVDAGALDGKTSHLFLQQVKCKYKAIYCFEPDNQNFRLTRKNLQDIDRLTCVPLGLWSQPATLSFSAQNHAGSRIDEQGACKVRVTSLDEYFQNTPVQDLPTFIKMDIEGAEDQALQGAKSVIAQARPKLAICAYHKQDDFYRLIRTIRSMDPHYQFYFRHYGRLTASTILYAYCP